MNNQTNNIKILKLVPQNYYITPIKYSSLIGHIIWYINLNESEGKAKEFINYMKDSPIFVSSDAFEFGYLPKPYAKLNLNKTLEDIFPDKFRKSFKKIHYVPITTYPYFFNKLKQEYNITTEKQLLDFIKQGKSQIGQSYTIMHNSINRQLGKVHKGALWEVQAKTTDEKGLWLIIKILDPEKWQYFNLQQIIPAIFEQHGYGKKKNIGYGQFNATWLNKKQTLEALQMSNNLTIDFSLQKNYQFVTLTDFMPCANFSAINFAYKLSTKYGKYSSFTQYQTNNAIYFKKPTIFISAGASGIANDNKEYLGATYDNSIPSTQEGNPGKGAEQSAENSNINFRQSYEFGYGLGITIKNKE